MSSDSLSAAGPPPIRFGQRRASPRGPRRKVAGDALVEAAVAEIGDVVRHHAAHDLEAAAEPCFEHVDIADAVLEADDHRAVCGACSAISLAASAVAPLLTQSRMISASSSASGTQAIIDLAGQLRVASRHNRSASSPCVADVLRDASAGR